jgi:predicted acetyltransferase
MQYEGKIGYGISPSERQKGYAAMLLLLALENVEKEE